MPIIALDMETFYDREYSLSRLRETDYILDPRFETIMCAVKEGTDPSEVFIGRDAVVERLSRIDWTQAAMLSHNSRFDGSILAWHYGHVPAMYLDTLSMARATTHAIIGSSSLASVAAYLGLGAKGGAVADAKGKRLRDFTPNDLALYADYCRNDNELCRQIFDRFMETFPKRELAIIDMAIRMFVEPQVYLNPSRLRAHRTVVRVEKAAIMDRVAHIDAAVFSSTTKFTELLEGLGVEIPTKPSPADPTRLIPAMAKHDVGFRELVEDPGQSLEVQALLAARMNAKSTIDETRADALLGLSRQRWPSGPVGCLPVPLKYYGAHTGRFSGDGGYNCQNLRRGGAIKQGIVAPPGWVIVHRDASQIEARMVAWLAGCTPLLEAFAAGRDVYSEFASGVYRRPITRADKLERFVGKTCILGLGYGTGHKKLRNTLFIGNGGISVTVDEAEAMRLVEYYRSSYRAVPGLWRRCEALLLRLVEASKREGANAAGTTLQKLNSYAKRPIPAIAEGLDALWLPNGMSIAYPDLSRDLDQATGNVAFTYRGPKGQRRHIYGAKVVENVSQALSRVVLTEIMLRVREQTGLRPFLTTHDSLDYCVPEAQAEDWHEYLRAQFAYRPAWAATLPLASEGGWGRTLAEAERGRPEIATVREHAA